MATGTQVRKTESIFFDLSGQVVDYQRILEIQRALNSLRNRGQIHDSLIMLQHNPVYTTGIHDNPEEYSGLHQKPVKVERGGSVTYHGPGQLVVYFIVNLKDKGISVLDLIRLVQESVIAFLRRFGISAIPDLGKRTGVWVNDRKICSIGLAVREFTTLHGIAVNINNDLTEFDPIMPCGFSSSVMTSLRRETGKSIQIELAASLLIENIAEILSLDVLQTIVGAEKLEEYVSGLLSETAPSRTAEDNSMNQYPFH
ncbi:MAG: lipoyl(octanoyl) transferase LipB [Thermoplasmataceae archaeon]